MSNTSSIKWFLILLSQLLLSGCLATLPDILPPAAGTYQVSTSLTFQGRDRTFLLHVPPNYTVDKRLPLVVVLHGAFSTGKQTEEETGFSTLADSESFLVAYPEGIGLFGLLQHWNAGHCCGKAADDQIDDVGFIAEVINTVRQKVSLDSSRIYMAGMSNGGMLAYRYAAERTNDLAAAAVVSGAIGSSLKDEYSRWRLQQPVSSLPIIIIHGLDDDAVPVNGGISPQKGGNRTYSSVADAVDFWKQANGCETPPVATFSNQGTVNNLLWNNCRKGGSIEYLALAGWGHQWPAPWFTDRLEKDHPLRGFDATRQIWTFFSTFRRSKAQPGDK